MPDFEKKRKEKNIWDDR